MSEIEKNDKKGAVNKREKNAKLIERKRMIKKNAIKRDQKE